MKEDFSVKERTGTEKAKIRYRLIWLIESMRYDKSGEDDKRNNRNSTWNDSCK